MDYKVTVCMPACNEEAAVGDTVKHIKRLHPHFEVIVVDDGSSDDTARAAREAGATVYSHPYNMGNGAAVKTGIRKAQGAWIVMMDADGQHNPDDIERLLQDTDTYGMIVGARTKASQTLRHRDLANMAYNTFASYVTNFRIKDLTSGFRAIRRDLAREFLPLLPNSFSYPTTLTMACLRNGYALKYIPITTSYRIGKSKIRLYQDGVRFFLIITRVATLFSPFKVFLPVSGTLFLTGMCYYLYTYITVDRFTNMSALVLSTSVITFMMGLISEQITQLRYDRPQGRKVLTREQE